MITFNDKIELDNDCAHWYINKANEEEVNVFDLFEIILMEHYLNETMEE